jgi:nucleotidyltransferase/DNA polymerase involved in DNA repair
MGRAPPSRGRDRRHGFGRAQLLQVFGKVRLRSRQAARLRGEEAKAWLAPQVIGRPWGISKAGQGRLEGFGFRRIVDLLRIDEREAVSRLGEDGRRLWGLARGSMIVR